MNEPNVSNPSGPTSGTRSSVKEARFAHRTEALFRALSSDYLLREQFVSDPARILADYVLDERVSEDLADTANQLLYVVVSSPRLASWLTSYALQLKSTVPSPQAFTRNFAQAVSTCGDDLAVLALIHAATRERDHFSLQADLLRAVAVALGISRGGATSGTEVTPGPGPGTDVTPGPGPGTEVSPGGGRIPIREMTRVLQIIQRVIRGNPGVFSSGTEVTPGPGPGTDVTPGPGPGTEVSPGGGRIPIREMTRVLQIIQRVIRGNPGVFFLGDRGHAWSGSGDRCHTRSGPGHGSQSGRKNFDQRDDARAAGHPRRDPRKSGRVLLGDRGHTWSGSGHRCHARSGPWHGSQSGRKNFDQRDDARAAGHPRCDPRESGRVLLGDRGHTWSGSGHRCHARSGPWHGSQSGIDLSREGVRERDLAGVDAIRHSAARKSSARCFRHRRAPERPRSMTP